MTTTTKKLPAAYGIVQGRIQEEDPYRSIIYPPPPPSLFLIIVFFLIFLIFNCEFLVFSCEFKITIIIGIENNVQVGSSDWFGSARTDPRGVQDLLAGPGPIWSVRQSADCSSGCRTAGGASGSEPAGGRSVRRRGAGRRRHVAAHLHVRSQALLLLGHAPWVSDHAATGPPRPWGRHFHIHGRGSRRRRRRREGGRRSGRRGRGRIARGIGRAAWNGGAHQPYSHRAGFGEVHSRPAPETHPGRLQPRRGRADGNRLRAGHALGRGSRGVPAEAGAAADPRGRVQHRRNGRVDVPLRRQRVGAPRRRGGAWHALRGQEPQQDQVGAPRHRL